MQLVKHERRVDGQKCTPWKEDIFSLSPVPTKIVASII